MASSRNNPLPVPSGGSGITLNYVLSCSETLEILSDSDWLHVSDISNNTITVIVDENTGDNVRNGTLTPKVGDDICSGKIIYVKQSGGGIPPTPTDNYKDLRNSFNVILSNHEFNEITDDSDYDEINTYLRSSYNMASSEYDKENSFYFTKSTYEEVFLDDSTSQWGTDKTYENDGTAKMAMVSWLMAMQLAELVNNNDGGNANNSNVQTDLFNAAYTFGGGRNIPIYGKTINGVYNGYSLKGDVNIARLAASSLYSIIRREDGTYNFDKINEFRRQLGGSTFTTGVDFDEIESNDKCNYCSIVVDTRANNDNIVSVGYAVNASAIFPSAAGPFITTYNTNASAYQMYKILDLSAANPTCKEGPYTETGYCYAKYQNPSANRTYPSEQAGSNPEQIFNTSTKNYLFDEKVYNTVVSSYNLRTDENNINQLERTAQACADNSEGLQHMFADDKKYSYNTYGNCCNNGFYLDDNGSKKIKGIFSPSVLNTNALKNLVGTSILNSVFDTPTEEISSTRKTILLPQYGRRRPGQGQMDATAAHVDRGDGNKDYDLLTDSTISAIAGGYTMYNENAVRIYYDLNNNQTYDASDTLVSASCYGGGIGYAHTYPSGHSTRTWAMGLMLIHLYPERAEEIYKAAYSFTISRTILRAHWNSDTLYGKLHATMMTPLQNAKTDYIENFKCLIKKLNGEECGGDIPGLGQPGRIYFRVSNKSGKDLTFAGDFNMCCGNGPNDTNGIYYGSDGTQGCTCYNGAYNRVGRIGVEPDGTHELSGATLANGSTLEYVYSVYFSHEGMVCYPNCTNSSTRTYGFIGRKLYGYNNITYNNCTVYSGTVWQNATLCYDSAGTNKVSVVEENTKSNPYWVVLIGGTS